ncbi:hypothetical protein B0A50_05734 [Salinomyces thailandicus]|uniref:Mannosyltransferase n=1 Tax=Salinomyces thailandicus TaxID=706561 RepID=A0A4U0TS43_9PEZI|nr:hypothetical protein B0A50_05734 [Salinomyces thailandica]
MTSTQPKVEDKGFTSFTPGWATYSLLFSLRMANAQTLQTFFQPDEYFQALEPAWQLAFGPESGAWITWEWREGLRSCLHPMLFAAWYKILAWICDALDAGPRARADALVTAPQIPQAIIAALGDFFTWLLARKIYGPDSSASNMALFLTAASPWQWFCSVRSFSNSLETVLTVTALYYWPWDWYIGYHPNVSSESHESSPTKGLKTSLLAAAVACMLRPTNILIWAVLAIMLFRYDTSKLFALVGKASLCGSAVLGLSLLADTAFYGKFSFPPLKFLQFNVVQSLSSFYGVNRPDYYFTEGLPLLLTTTLPFALLGLWQALRARPKNQNLEMYRTSQITFVLALTVLVMVLTMTLISHKEVRFIYPLLPTLLILAAKPLATFLKPTVFFSPPRSPTTNHWRGALFVLMVFSNYSIARYASSTHQRGVIDVMRYLRHQQEARLLHTPAWQNPNMTVGFLMPCHSTPWRSHLVHPEIQAWALTCEPPLHIPVDQRQDYLDEADIFYKKSASTWVSATMQDIETIMDEFQVPETYKPRDKQGELRAWPEYLVFFEQLLPTLEEILGRTRYRECWRGFNTHWHDDWRRKGDVMMWCLPSASAAE